MIQDFKTQLDKPKPSQLRRHRHKLIVIGLSILAAALLLQFAADPDETTAATRSAPITQHIQLPGQMPLPAEQTAQQPALNPAVVKLPATDKQPSSTTGASPASETAAAKPANHWVEHHISSGENLATIFHDIGLSPQLLHRITHSSDKAASLARIRPGQTLRFELGADHQLVRLEHVLNPITKLQITADGDGFTTQEVRKDVQVRLAEASGTINDSLFVDGQAAGLTDGQVMELAGIFGWDIDFALELRKGDHFSLIYEEQYLDGQKFRNGPILAAEFINRGTSYRAVRYEDGKGNVGYYDPDGRSKRRAFLRTPVKFARISSGFTTRRWHPLLHKWRSHKGVDYAAPTGTPIKATGAGRVVFRGWKGGYGKVIIIKHGVKYSTLYGHMSRFNKHVTIGTRVKQGQIIGYVGMTGLATGPHLHYEFRVDGVHRNPLTVKLPKASPLPKAQLTKFRTSSAPLLARLDALEPPTLVAKADTSKP